MAVAVSTRLNKTETAFLTALRDCMTPGHRERLDRAIASGDHGLIRSYTTFPRQELLAVARSIGKTCIPARFIDSNHKALYNNGTPTPRPRRGMYRISELLDILSEVKPAAAPEEIKEIPASKPVSSVVAAASGQTISAPVSSSEDIAMALSNGEAKTFVPAAMSGYVPYGYFDDCESIIRSGMFYPVFITGLSGNGKTTMIDQVCAKLKRELFRVNITVETDEDDLLGGFRLVDGSTVWQDGPVVTAMERGGILLLDEIDLASSKIMCLQPVLEGKGVFLKKVGRFVKPAAGFTVFATANTKGKGSDDGRFVGTNVMNEAFLDRFPICIEQDYPPAVMEKKILYKKMAALGMDKGYNYFADNLVKWATTIRKSYAESTVDEIITTRRLLNIIEGFAIFSKKRRAIELGLARFDQNTKTVMMELYKKIDADLDNNEIPGAAEASFAKEVEASASTF